MIVRMKKLTLLCTVATKQQTLEKLRELGVLHVQHVQTPQGYELDKARNHLSYVQRAEEVLMTRQSDAQTSDIDPHQLVDTVWKLIHDEKELKETLQSLQHEKARMTPFGDFDPRVIEKLTEESGVFIKLYEFSVKGAPSIPEGVYITEISRDATKSYIMAAARKEFSLSAHEVRLPDRSLSQIEHHIKKTEKALEENDIAFQTYAADRHLAEKITVEAADSVTYEEVKHGMAEEGAVCYLNGFYPIDVEDTLIDAASKYGWGYSLADVTDKDTPPTLLRNPKWVNPVKAVFGMIGVIPGYRELDVSALFLIFLSIFFGFLIGDAGYGLLFIALTLFGKIKTKGNEAAKPALNLMLLMSSFCVIYGVLTGNYFGITIEALPAPLKGLTSNFLTGKTAEGWDADLAAKNVMFVCFAIGTIHLTLAHGWNLIRKINSPACLTDVGWLCSTWALFSVVLQMVLYIELPKWVTATQLPLLGVGIVLIILSLVLTKSYFGLVTLALDVINNFVDIISYVRLYAVGAASLAIAQAFNGMAMDIGFSGVGAIGAALILFLGHGLNIILGAMGVMVHGIRLNTLEFSGHAGVEWGGIHFNPFKKNANNL
jgi:V/A-type H+/Na+-transporting ATPase subunit I